MRQVVKEYRSKIQYTVIGPYLGLMILVMLIGSFVAVTLVADSWQERFNNQLGQIARNFAESFAQREIGNLNYLNTVTHTAPNPKTGAPAVDAAMANRDTVGLEEALLSLWLDGQSRENVKADRLIVFDPNGQAFSDWERNPVNSLEPIRNPSTNIKGSYQIDKVLGGGSSLVPGSDNTVGDKYSGLINFKLANNQDNLYFFSVAPVYWRDPATDTDRLVGGVLVAQHLDVLLKDLQTRSQASVSMIYDVDGTAYATTATDVTLEDLVMAQTLIAEVVKLNAEASDQQAGNSPDPCVDIGNLPGRLVSPVARTRLPACSVVDVRLISEYQYQFVYAPLLIRGVQSGYFAVGLSTDFVISAWSDSRSVVIGITAALALSAVLIGWQVARRITRPLSNLVETAEAVTSGDLRRRSTVTTHNELGKLSLAFNQMTEHLMRLYTVSRELNRTIEVAQVLAVVSEAASSFVTDTEAVALLEEPEGFRYYGRPAASALVPAAEIVLSASTPLLAELATRDPQAIQLLRVTSEAVLEAAGLDPSLGTVYNAPVFRQHQLAGALLFLHQNSDAFNEANTQSLAVIANMAVAVLANAVLYGQVQRDAKERRAILASIGDGVMVCNDKGRIVLLNNAAEQMLDLPDWQTTRPYFTDLPLEAVSQSQELFGQAGTQFRLGPRFLTLTQAPVIGEEGQPSGEVLVLHDVTETVAMDKAKTDFIATISHELRSPLTVIRGYTELLLRGSGGEKPSADQTELLTQVRLRAVDMTDMVNNAIMIADIESGQLETECEPLDLAPVVNAALAPLRQNFTAKNLTVTIELPATLPPVQADREQLKRAIAQLLDNARRYTERGGVTLRASSEGPYVQIAVIDTGPGIAPEVLPRLFKRFQRIDGNNSAQRGGGLGLAITRQLIERQGGTVGVTSEVGQGSIFTICLQQVNEHSLEAAQTNEATRTP